MKKLLVVPFMLFAVAAHAAEAIIIINVMPHPNNPLYHSMVEYMIAALGRAVGVV